jgi:hypothetical protein
MWVSDTNTFDWRFWNSWFEIFNTCKTWQLGIQERKDLGKNSSINISKGLLLKGKFDNSCHGEEPINVGKIGFNSSCDLISNGILVAF